MAKKRTSNNRNMISQAGQGNKTDIEYYDFKLKVIKHKD